MNRRKRTQPSAWEKILIIGLSLISLLGLVLVFLIFNTLISRGSISLPWQQTTPTPTLPTMPPASTDVGQPTAPAPLLTPSAEATALPEAEPVSTVTETLPTPAPSIVPEVVTPTVEATAQSPLQLQTGSAQYMQAFNHMDLGCKWTGIAGQVFDERGAGMADVLIVARGKQQGRKAEWMGLTSADSPYGPGGYEITLSNYLPGAAASLEVQVYNLQGEALSAPYRFALPSSCEANLLLVSFHTTSENNLFLGPE